MKKVLLVACMVLLFSLAVNAEEKTISDEKEFVEGMEICAEELLGMNTKGTKVDVSIDTYDILQSLYFMGMDGEVRVKKSSEELNYVDIISWESKEIVPEGKYDDITNTLQELYGDIGSDKSIEIDKLYWTKNDGAANAIKAYMDDGKLIIRYYYADSGIEDEIIPDDEMQSEDENTSKNDTISEDEPTSEEETSNNSEYDFKTFRWGDSQETVVSVEGKPDKEGALKNIEAHYIKYNTTVATKDAILTYYFCDDGLYSVRYNITEKHSNEALYIDDYEYIKRALTKKYGKPFYDEEDWQNDDCKKYYQDKKGDALQYGYLTYYTWYNLERTDIYMYMSADNYVISTVIEYVSKDINPGAPDYSGDL